MSWVLKTLFVQTNNQEHQQIQFLYTAPTTKIKRADASQSPSPKAHTQHSNSTSLGLVTNSSANTPATMSESSWEKNFLPRSSPPRDPESVYVENTSSLAGFCLMLAYITPNNDMPGKTLFGEIHGSSVRPFFLIT
ncbi:hypothetical protein HYFRA_00006650 [Hymenoscyphus fraxineus]|uniref:Uncharacterized protein n=1 Tax=Hymenoscyphus fraxineus TaxID=746836 RepID=A0A9N9KTS0_9HELO|nr:hypothetical protein HYFRA_00006650 [Hymenoscyphus fraxineus]